MLSNSLLTVVKMIKDIGGEAYIVGGAVRDYMLYNRFTADIDIEVFDVSGKTLQSILETVGKVTVAGKFSIFTLTVDGMKYDFSLPRRETKTGRGYMAFEIEIDPTMTLQEAASRRDFTINAMMLSLPNLQLFDPFGGLQDLEESILHPTSSKFVESPERVMRGMQFISRFNLISTDTAILYSRALLSEADTIDRSQFWKHFDKWANGMNPDKGLDFLVSTEWITLFPELSDLIGLPQDPIWHPEGDAWVHTKLVVKAMRNIIAREGITDPNRIMVLMLTALLHDVGKPSTTVIGDRITSKGHAEAGIIPAIRFMDKIGTPHKIRDQVVQLIREHMAHIGFDATFRSVRKLAVRLHPATIDDLALVFEADHSGRDPLPKGMPANGKRILSISQELNITVEKPMPIIQGRHLIEAGLKPNSGFKAILGAAFEAQINGEFDTLESGKQWLTTLLKSQS